MADLAAAFFWAACIACLAAIIWLTAIATNYAFDRVMPPTPICTNGWCP